MKCSLLAGFGLMLMFGALGCGKDHANKPGDAGGRVAVDAGHDTGAPDTGVVDTGVADTGVPDTGRPDAALPDAGWWDAAAPTCNPTLGIECDGDWGGRCSETCAETQCCSPQHGAFACVEKNEDGTCPAADIWVDTTKIEGQTRVEWQYFAEDNCAIVEGCVAAAGWRRLLRFDTWTPNTGGADLFLGRPSDRASLFEYSDCHRHYHFNSYASYALQDPEDGAVAATGHKQAFCLLDYYSYPMDGTGRGVYNCSYQGIQRDWQDVYGSGLDCQWVDVTDVEPGTYDLQISLNNLHILNESNYDNNQATISVAIPEDAAPVDVTAACPRVTAGTERSCGLTRAGVFACTPGATVRAGCSAACGLGSCAGDPFMRVCPGDSNCEARRAITSNDDSGCAAGRCSDETSECCSQAEFTCPSSGQYTVLWGGYQSNDTEASCTVSASP